ncbi:MAG: acyl-CoA thioesterase [Flavobacteriales bacterium]|nr:acyl-CoA thioesterase [Flavobacteriales bacterium]
MKPVKTIKTKLQVRFNDLDMAGHVHNSEYLNYFEIGRIDFFNQVIAKDWDWKKQGILVARNELDYLKPIYFHNNIFVETHCEDIGKKSITLGYKIFNEKDGVKKLCSKGRSILVCFDFNKKESVEVFDQWKLNLEQ